MTKNVGIVSLASNSSDILWMRIPEVKELGLSELQAHFWRFDWMLRRTQTWLETYVDYILNIIQKFCAPKNGA